MDEQLTFEFDKKPVIKGFPELRWTGKRPYYSSQYYPAQCRERHGTETDGWINKIFWGDNLQVMSHLLKEFRGKIDLIYIDPPFASAADYKRKIEIKSKSVKSDSPAFEEKQYGDIWNNDEYLQFIYERLIMMRELLSEKGTIFVHCDWRMCSCIRLILDEVFGTENFLNEIIWNYAGGRVGHNFFGRKHDNIYWYAKTYGKQTFHYDDVRQEYATSTLARNQYSNNGSSERVLDYKPNADGKFPEDVWTISIINPVSKERTDYPTQKPEKLLETIIKAASSPGDLVFDCFMGSGTTQTVAMKLGRRFIGADINLGSVQTVTERLIQTAKKIQPELTDSDIKYTGFEVYNVNHYDFFRNPVEARELIMKAFEIQEYPQSKIWDGQKDGKMVKIMPINRIAAKADLEELKANLPYHLYEQRKAENPGQPVEQILLICMGHEPGLEAAFQKEIPEYPIRIEIMDILRNNAELELKRESQAEIVREGGKLVIRSFYPMNLLQKLSLQKEHVEEWKQLVASVMIDWNYDGAVMQPTVIDIPAKDDFVAGVYDIPKDVGTIRIKITDLISETLEMEV